MESLGLEMGQLVLLAVGIGARSTPSWLEDFLMDHDCRRDGEHWTAHQQGIPDVDRPSRGTVTGVLPLGLPLGRHCWAGD